MDNAALPAAAPPAESTSQKAMLALAGTIIRKLLTVGGTAAASHGVINSNGIETFVSIGLAVAGILWSFWNDYGRAIVTSQLEVLKAKSLAQAAKLQAHDLAPVTAQQIADAGPKELTAATVTKVAATLCLLLAFGSMLVATPAFAQLKKGPIGTAIDNAIQRDSGAQSGGTADDGKALRQKILKALTKPFQDLADFIGEDAENAIALSTSIPGLQDGHGQQCWIMARNFTAVIKAHPLPLTGQGMSDLEAGRLMAASANQLCGDSHCTQVFTDLKNQAVILAQAGFGLLGATAVNAAPGLQDICNKIATVKMVDPVLPVPAAPVIAPAAPP